MITAVIDVNVLVSAIIGPLGFSRQVLLAWEAEQFRVIASAGIIAQLEEKLSLDRITKRFTIDTPNAIRWVQLLLSTQAQLTLVPVQERLEVTGDPEDDYVLATGRLAHAEYLVSGDKGLLDLGQYAGMKVISPKGFVELLTEEVAI